MLPQKPMRPRSTPRCTMSPRRVARCSGRCTFVGMPMRLPKRCVALALGATLLGCNRASPPASAGAAPFSGSNPFANASPLLDQAPPFDRIHDADYQPAVEEGMRRQLAEVEGKASDTAAPRVVDTTRALGPFCSPSTRGF